jgi:cytochrome c biogenesis protein
VSTTFELTPREFGRFIWRQLTSMRTALLLLLLLVIVSIPGSVLPQQSTDAFGVRQWIENSPMLGNILLKLGFFNVFSSIWFSAVYLLLLISLVGCILPRSIKHYRAMRSQPPSAPANFERLNIYENLQSEIATERLLTEVGVGLKEKKWRVVIDQERKYVAAEKGYAREVGNLIFHLAVVGIILAVGIGVLFSYRGQMLVREGTAVASTPTQFSSLSFGTAVSVDELPAVTIGLNKFTAEFERGMVQRGAARVFIADVTVQTDTGTENVLIEVNKPLKVGGSTWYLVGHGYAPRVEVINAAGEVVFADSVIMLPRDGNFSSEGAIKIPAGEAGLGFIAAFFPTADFAGEPFSIFPSPDNPRLFLSAWQGDLGLDSGEPQSVFSLEVEGLERVGVDSIAPGETWKLPAGLGSVKFVSVERFVTFDVARSPGASWALGFSILALIGLVAGLYIRSRRIWLKQTAVGSYQIGALSRSDQPGLAADIKLIQALCSAAEEKIK